MNTPAPPADKGRPDISGPGKPVLVGRRAVMSGVLGISAGAALALLTSAASSPAAGAKIPSSGHSYPRSPNPAAGAKISYGRSHPRSPNPAAGAKIYSYGHSYTRSPSPYVTRRSYDEYQLQLGRWLRSGQVISHGVSGTRLLDTVSAIIAPTFAGSAGRRWRSGDQGIVLLHSMMNDVSKTEGGHPDYLNAYEKALRLAIGAFGAQSFIPADHASRMGRGWSLESSERLEDGRSWFTKTGGDEIDFLVTGGDTVHVSTLCSDPSVSSQGTLRAECNGVILGYFGRGRDNGNNASNRGKTYTDSVDHITRNRWSPAGWRITGLNTAAGTMGTKTLTLRKVDSTVDPVWVQGIYLTSDDAPLVLVAKEPPRNKAAVDKAPVDVFYRNETRYRALIDSVCDEYSFAHSVDLRPGWDNTTMVSKRDSGARFHPNTLGKSCIASNFERAINRYVTASTPGLR
jgi:hypothetical protein